MRPEHEWLSFLERVRADSTRRVVEGTGELVSPREGIMVPTPERRATGVKKDVDARVPQRVALSSAERIMEYRPLDVVARISPRALMVVAVEHDAVTPDDHAAALYQAASPPKKLLIQRNTTHYGAYARYGAVIAAEIVDWFSRYLTTGDVIVKEERDDRSVSYVNAPEYGGDHR
jgi:hypothetical protein